MTPTDAALAGLRVLIAELVDEALAKRGPANDEYMSPEQAAEVAKVAPATVRRWVREGKLPGHHAGRRVRVRRAELEEMLRDGPRDRTGLSPEAMALRDFG